MPTEVYFATNRREPTKPGGRFGDRFHSDGPHFFEVGRAQVTWRDAQIAKRDWDRYKVAYKLVKASSPPETVPLAEGLAPELHRKILSEGRPGSSKLFERLRAAMQMTGRDVLVYIHRNYEFFPVHASP